MTQDRDPFELLPRFVDSEPDPAIMNATIAQSREAFANRKDRTERAGPASFLDWARQSRNWLAPVGAVALAAAVVVAIVPGLGPSVGTADRELVADRPIAQPPMSDEAPTFSRGDEQLAETPPDNNAGSRMGMTLPQGGEQPISEALPQVVSSYQGDNILLELRLDAEALEIYLPDISGDRMLDAQNVMPGEQIEILAATQLEGELIAIHFRVGDVRFWRIYAQTDGVYGRDPELSTLVSDAADRAEVERRLDAK